MHEGVSIDTTILERMLNKVKKSNDANLVVETASLVGESVMNYKDADTQSRMFDAIFDLFQIHSTESVEESNKLLKKLESFLNKVLLQMENFSNIVNTDNFLFLLNSLNSDNKFNISKRIFDTLMSSTKEINDPLVAYNYIKLGKIVHDSKEFRLSEGEKKEIISLIKTFIGKINFFSDFPTSLNVLTECRAEFTYFDEITYCLIEKVIALARNVIVSFASKASKKQLRQVKLAIAFCQITIPSIKDSIDQIYLALETAKVALNVNLISECDSLLNYEITVLEKELEERPFNKLETTSKYIELINTTLSFLVVCPSNPDNPFAIASSFLGVFESQTTATFFSSLTKLHTLMNVIYYLSTQVQSVLPYRIPNVESNDEIFAGDVDFYNSAYSLADTCVNNVLYELSKIDESLLPGQTEEYRAISNFCYFFACCLKNAFEPNGKTGSVIKKLMSLTEKYADKFGVKEKERTELQRFMVNI